MLLMDDARFPWLVLVPMRAGITELHELAREERQVLIEEVARASERLKALSGADKINVGALGNVVSQLHIHVIGRSTGDVAWPGPVWGAGRSVMYTEQARETSAAEPSNSALSECKKRRANPCGAALLVAVLSGGKENDGQTAAFYSTDDEPPTGLILM